MMKLTRFLPCCSNMNERFIASRTFGSSGSFTGFNQSVLNDARKSSFAGISNTQEALIHKLQDEFQGERIDTTKRAEDKLTYELKILNDQLLVFQNNSNNKLSSDKLTVDKETFNLKRKLVLKLRGELIIQKEVSSSNQSFDASKIVESTYPIPAAL